MTFALLITYRHKVELVDYFYTSHPNRDCSDGQKKRLDIEIANNCKAVLFYKQKQGMLEILWISRFYA